MNSLIAQYTAPSVKGIINVQDPPYNAVPISDTSSPDSTTAFQQAITDASPKGAIFVPPGTYQVSSPLVIEGDGVTLCGIGYNQRTITVQPLQELAGSTIRASAAMGQVLKWAGRNGTLHGIKLDGNDLADNALTVVEAKDFAVLSCGFVRGVVTTLNFLDALRCLLVDSVVSHRGTGPGLHVAADSGNMEITSCRIQSDAVTSIQLTGGGCRFANCHVKIDDAVPVTADEVVLIDGVSNHAFVGGVFECAGVSGIGVTAGGGQLIVTGCIFTNVDPPRPAIHLHAAVKSVITGNQFTSGQVAIELDLDGAANRCVFSGNMVRSVEGLHGNKRPGQLRGNTWEAVSGGYAYDSKAGVASVADGDAIAHGLTSTPRSVQLTSATNVARFVSAYDADAAQFNVMLLDGDEGSVTTPEDVYWYAEV